MSLRGFSNFPKVVGSVRSLSTIVAEPSLKTFDDIPGPSGKGLPFLGHSLLFTKKPAGFGKSWENVKALKAQYLKDNDTMLKLYSPLLNPKPNNGYVIMLFDPDDVEIVYRNEGKYPNR